MITFEIILKDGSYIYPAYPKEHKDKVRNFYKGLYAEGAITGWGIYSIEGDAI